MLNTGGGGFVPWAGSSLRSFELWPGYGHHSGEGTALQDTSPALRPPAHAPRCSTCPCPPRPPLPTPPKRSQSPQARAAQPVRDTTRSLAETPEPPVRGRCAQVLRATAVPHEGLLLRGPQQGGCSHATAKEAAPQRQPAEPLGRCPHGKGRALYRS